MPSDEDRLEKFIKAREKERKGSILAEGSCSWTMITCMWARVTARYRRDRVCRSLASGAAMPSVDVAAVFCLLPPSPSPFPPLLDLPGGRGEAPQSFPRVSYSPVPPEPLGRHVVGHAPHIWLYVWCVCVCAKCEV